MITAAFEAEGGASHTSAGGFPRAPHPHPPPPCVCMFAHTNRRRRPRCPAPPSSFFQGSSEPAYQGSFEGFLAPLKNERSEPAYPRSAARLPLISSSFSSSSSLLHASPLRRQQQRRRHQQRCGWQHAAAARGPGSVRRRPRDVDAFDPRDLPLPFRPAAGFLLGHICRARPRAAVVAVVHDVSRRRPRRRRLRGGAEWPLTRRRSPGQQRFAVILGLLFSSPSLPPFLQLRVRM